MDDFITEKIPEPSFNVFKEKGWLNISNMDLVLKQMEGIESIPYKNGPFILAKDSLY